MHFISVFIVRKLIICLIIRYVSLNVRSYYPYIQHLHRCSNSGHFWVLTFSCNLTEIHKFCRDAVLLTCSISELQETSSSGLEPRTVFRCRSLCSCGLLIKRNNVGLDSVLPSCSVYGQQKISSPEIEPRTLFRCCRFCSYNILFETKNFGFSAVLLSCLFSEL